jgi:hypothetical protein
MGALTKDEITRGRNHRNFLSTTREVRMKILGTMGLGVVLSSLVFVGCDKDDIAHPGTTVNNTAKAPKMMGKWESECKGSKILSKSLKEFYDFTGGTFTKATEYYSNGNCENPAAVVQYKGEFHVDAENAKVENARDVVYHYKTAMVKPLNDEGVNLLKVANFCGQKDWKVNEKKDLTGQSKNTLCPIFNVPQDYFDVAKIDNSELFIGMNEGHLMDTPDHRPDQLDRQNPFVVSKHGFAE